MTDSFKFAYEELLKKNTQLNAKLVALDQMVIVAQERYAKYIDELIDKMNQFRFDVLELVSDEDLKDQIKDIFPSVIAIKQETGKK